MSTSRRSRTSRLALFAASLLLATTACSSQTGPPAATEPETGADSEASSEPATPAPRVMPGWDPASPERITVASTDFEAGEEFPRTIELNGYGCHGPNIRPEIHWEGLPEGTESVIITFTAEGGGPLNRWTLFDVPPDVTSIPGGTDEPAVGTLARNGVGQTHMLGPCSDEGETWELWFTVYATDTTFGLRHGASQAALQEAVMGHVLAAGELAGTHSDQED